MESVIVGGDSSSDAALYTVNRMVNTNNIIKIIPFTNMEKKHRVNTQIGHSKYAPNLELKLLALVIKQ